MAISSIKEMCKRMNIGNLKQWGIEEGAFYKAIPKMAEDAIASGSPSNNPKIPTKEELMELYHTAYTYEF